MINRNSYAEKCSIPVQISISEGHNFSRDVTVSRASSLDWKEDSASNASKAAVLAKCLHPPVATDTL